MANGFVSQISLRSVSCLAPTDLAYRLCKGNAKGCEAVEDGSTDLDLRDLPIKVARREALAKQFQTMHLCFEAAWAVVSSQLPPQCAPEVF